MAKRKPALCKKALAVCATGSDRESLAFLCDSGKRGPKRYYVYSWSDAYAYREHRFVDASASRRGGFELLLDHCTRIGGEVASLDERGRLPTPWWDEDDDKPRRRRRRKPSRRAGVRAVHAPSRRQYEAAAEG